MDELTATKPIPLSDAALADLPAAVARPRYDRAGLKPGIVHIGLGNFHRAHQAWYLHRLMQQGLAQDWAIIGAGVRPQDALMREKLLRQDCLTTLIELAPNHRSAEVIGPMIDYLPVEMGHAPLIAAMADPAIRIVALTVTEGGYYQRAASGDLDSEHPDIRHDIDHPDTPVTAFGAMVAALRRRRAAGQRPFTGLSCDNLTGNGRILRQAILGLAHAQEPALAAWIAREATFPNAMVDSIVPATGPSEIALAQSFGIDDLAPVSHENFRQWVLEDRFCNGRPEWEAVGVTFTDDVHGHEMLKLRILNAGHQMLANVGELLSLSTIADCMAEPAVAAFFRKVQEEEVLPHVGAVPGTSPSQYLALVEHRFRNPAIRDTTRRVAFDGSARHPGFVRPIIEAALAEGAPISGLALVEALWARMCFGTREDGTTIAQNDPIWPDLQKAATAARQRPETWLDQDAIYGPVSQAAAFRRPFATWLERLFAQGTAATLVQFLSSEG